MSQKLLLSIFKWIDNLYEFAKGFIKTYNEKGKEQNFLEVDIQYPENIHNAQNKYHSYPIEQKVEKVLANLNDKMNTYSHRIFKTSIKSWISFGKNS